MQDSNFGDLNFSAEQEVLLVSLHISAWRLSSHQYAVKVL
jgi:hypothetical protein